MNCRRCGRELPVGQGKVCPYCGVYLDPIITPRVKGEKLKRSNVRVARMSLLSVAFTVVAVVVLINFITRANSQRDLAAIEASYHELLYNEASYSKEEWDLQLNAFSAAVSNYESAYPNREENIDLINRYLNILAGFDPDTGDFVGSTTQERHNRELIQTARDTVIDLTEVSFSAADGAGNSTLTFRLVNRSEELTISEVSMAFEAFDSSGNPSNGSSRGDNRWFVRTGASILPGDDDDYLFQTAWGERDIADVKILWMEVKYGPNTPSVYLPPAVCEALWR